MAGRSPRQQAHDGERLAILSEVTGTDRARICVLQLQLEALEGQAGDSPLHLTEGHAQVDQGSDRHVACQPTRRVQEQQPALARATR